MTKQVTLSEKAIAKLNTIKGTRSYSEIIDILLPMRRSQLMRLANTTQEQLFSLFKHNPAVPLNSEIIDSILTYIREVNSLTLTGNLEEMRLGTLKFADDLAKIISKIKESA